jgi:hypothetical protein
MPQQKKTVDIRQVENLAARGLDNEKIRLALGLSSSTFYKRKRESAEIAEALMRGRAKGEMVMSDKLWEFATEQKEIFVDDEETGGKKKVTVYAHDDRSRLEAVKFWLERRAGWVKTDKLDMSSSDGSMSPQSGTVVSLAGMDPDEVARLARRAFKGE